MVEKETGRWESKNDGVLAWRRPIRYRATTESSARSITWSGLHPPREYPVWNHQRRTFRSVSSRH